MSKMLAQADKLLEKVEESVFNPDWKEPIEDAIDFIKRHKKILITVGVLYFVYKYLFEEEEDYE